MEAQHPKVAAFDDPVKLNIGGVKYETSLSLLQKFPHSMLGCMFRYLLPSSGGHALLRTADLIDSLTAADVRALRCVDLG